jgi:sugar lactone lactonase YvrE
MQRRHLLAAVLTTALVGTGGAAIAAPATKGPGHHGHHGSTPPAHIELPAGYQPEGIAAGGRHELFVGSIPSGQVLRVDTRTGATETAVPARPGHAAIGLKADRRGTLFVAGGPTGKAFAYDSDTGAELAAFQLAPDATTFVNDVTLTRHGAYFTDSRRQAIYRVRRDLQGFQEIATPGIPLGEGNNLNGIAATRNGRFLLAVQSNSGALWRIDPRTGDAVQVDLGGVALTNGDGLLLEGHKLYVVQNRDNRIAVVHLRDRWTTGTVERELTSDDFDVPTTLARQDGGLYAVNARFGTAGAETADYWITRLQDGRHHHGRAHAR